MDKLNVEVVKGIEQLQLNQGEKKTRDLMAYQTHPSMTVSRGCWTSTRSLMMAKQAALLGCKTRWMKVPVSNPSGSKKEEV